jgi:hypothetical protein
MQVLKGCHERCSHGERDGALEMGNLGKLARLRSRCSSEILGFSIGDVASILPLNSDDRAKAIDALTT